MTVLQVYIFTKSYFSLLFLNVLFLFIYKKSLCCIEPHTPCVCILFVLFSLVLSYIFSIFICHNLIFFTSVILKLGQIYFAINHIKNPEGRERERDRHGDRDERQRKAEKWSKEKRAMNGNSFSQTFGHMHWFCVIYTENT